MITTAAFEQLPEILALQKRCYTENALRYDDFGIQPMTQTLAELECEFSHMTVLVYLLDGRIIGSVRACEREGTAWIFKVIVDPAHQNRGIGKALVRAAEELFPRAAACELYTGSRDEKNLHLYTSLGYRPTRTEYVNDAFSFVYLRKERGGAAEGTIEGG